MPNTWNQNQASKTHENAQLATEANGRSALRWNQAISKTRPGIYYLGKSSWLRPAFFWNGDRAYVFEKIVAFASQTGTRDSRAL